MSTEKSTKTETSLKESIQKAWTTEASRRRDEVRLGQVQTIPVKQVLTEVRQMLDR